MDNREREERFRKLVEGAAPGDPFLALEHAQGMRWEAIWNTYLAEEFEGKKPYSIRIDLKGVPQG